MDFKSKTYRRAPIIGVIGVLMLVVVISGCAGNKTTDKSSITDSISNAFRGSTDIEDIVKNPNSYYGKTVTVVGKPSWMLHQEPRTQKKKNLPKDRYEYAYETAEYPYSYDVEKIEGIKPIEIGVITKNLPEEESLCIEALEVTGVVNQEENPLYGFGSSEKYLLLIKETSRKIISVNKKLCGK